MIILVEQQPRPHCPQCGSENVSYDQNYGFYKCNDCRHNWAYDKDDPDYDEEGDEEKEIDLLG